MLARDHFSLVTPSRVHLSQTFEMVNPREPVYSFLQIIYLLSIISGSHLALNREWFFSVKKIFSIGFFFLSPTRSRRRYPNDERGNSCRVRGRRDCKGYAIVSYEHSDRKYDSHACQIETIRLAYIAISQRRAFRGNGGFGDS